MRKKLYSLLHVQVNELLLIMLNFRMVENERAKHTWYEFFNVCTAGFIALRNYKYFICAKVNMPL